jgi:hypothetical protein
MGTRKLNLKGNAMKRFKDSIKKFLSSLWILILTYGCYVEDNGVSDLESESNGMKAEDFDKKEKEEEKGPTNEANEWLLAEIEDEKYYCWDDFYEYVENPAMFCDCVIEKVSRRWGYEDYLRHQYGYLKRLSDNETLQRCNETPDFWKDEEEDEEELADDRAYDPEEIEEEEEEEEEQTLDELFDSKWERQG